MNMKAHILAALREKFNDWEALLASLTEAQLTDPRFPDNWSVKDILAHVWAWQQRTLARIEGAAQNHEPQFPPWPANIDPEAEDVNQLNAWIYESNRNQPWVTVYQNWRTGFLRLLELSETISERDLLDESRYQWINGYPLAFVLVGTYDHHQEHYEKLLAWLQASGGKPGLILDINRDITVQQRFEAGLQAANMQLTIGMRELERRNTEAALLNAMGELLQSCDDVTEAYYVIRSISQKLFPDEVGMLGIAVASHDFLEVVAQWGNQKISEAVFAINDCWALRRGRVHHSHPGEGAPFCTHLSSLPDATYLCIPLMAHGETFGVFSLCRFAADDLVAFESHQRLAQTVADSIGLALANLRLRDTLRNQSIRDSLTGLFNRRYMEETLDRELRRAARDKYSVGVMMIDVDHFKRFNDTYGHSSGDMLLTELGKFFNQNLRGGEIACRYGGEEFTIILPQVTLETTRKKAQVLGEACKKVHTQHDGQSLGTVTLSIGISAFPEHGTNGNTLLEAADTALYYAKRNGRDQVVAPGEVTLK